MNLRVFMRQLSRRIRERLTGMWNFSSLEKKLALAVSLIVVFIVGLFSLASFYLTKSHYEAMLYQSMSTSSSLVTYLLSSHLNDAVQLPDAIRSDAVIQHHLDLIYQDKDYRRSNSYDNIYTSQLNYYLQYKKPYLTYSAITNPRFVTYTYDYRYNRFSEEMLQEMQAEAARALGAPVWFSRYAEDGYLYLIRQIKKEVSKPITLYTNSILAAAELLDVKHVRLHLIGGEIAGNLAATSGPDAEQSLASLKADLCFFGTNGVSCETGASVIGYSQMRLKQTMLSASRKHILLADSHKFGLQFLSVICPLSEIDLIITDSCLSAAKLEAFQKQASVLRSGS